MLPTLIKHDWVGIIKSDTQLSAACTEWYPLKDECQTAANTSEHRIQPLTPARLHALRLVRQMPLSTVDAHSDIARLALLPGPRLVLSFTLVQSFAETQPIGVDGAWREFRPAPRLRRRVARASDAKRLGETVTTAEAVVVDNEGTLDDGAGTSAAPFA
jgi:hypothetical protein